MSVSQAETRTARTAATVIWLVVLLAIGVAGILCAEFPFDGTAESSQTWHFFQHGVFVVGGVLIGISGLKFYALGQKRT